jgi:hypothetical protein
MNMADRKCPSCGTQVVVDQASSCMACGARLPAPPSAGSTGSPASSGDLGSKYLSAQDLKESKTGKEANAAKQGLGALAGAAACVTLGIVLTNTASSGSGTTVYYGLVWVGATLAFEGMHCLLTGTGYGRISKPVRVVYWVVGLIIAFVYMIAMMK